jgi:hypothetical protein
MIKETKVKKSQIDLIRQSYGMKMVMKISFYNERTMWETGKLKQIGEELATYKLKMIGLSEERLNGFGENTTAKGNSFM